MTGNCSCKRHRTDPSLINRFWSRMWLWLLRKSFHESCCCSWSILRGFEWHLCLIVECYNLMRTLTSSYSLKEIMDVTTKRGGKRSPDSSVPQPHWQGKGQNLILTKGVEAALCQHEVVLPSIMSSSVPSTWLLAKIPRRLEKALAFWVLTCPSQGSHSHSRLLLQPWCQGLQDSRGEQPAARRKLHLFLKDLQNWIQG